MVSNYEEITRENIREYGQGTRHLAFLGQLYSDRTHFILEVLQNAEDANANAIDFDLYHDRLEVRHNGRDFSYGDVAGICGVDLSTKAQDLTKIGKFGVGFKSVYAYTMSPQIYSGDEHFEIQHYVRPVEVLPKTDLAAGQTLQCFPFNQPSVPSHVAYEEIERALEALDSSTVLFLRNVTIIRIRTANIDRALEKNVIAEYPRLIETAVIAGSDRESNYWWVFSKRHTFEGREGLPIQIAIQVRPDTDEDGNATASVTPFALDSSPLFVTFATQKETGLGFLLQGPFRTTPARDNVPTDDKWNLSLIEAATDLTKSTLRDLKELGLLSMAALSTMPIRSDLFTYGSMFRPLFDGVLNVLNTEALVPTAAGSHSTSDNIRISRVSSVQELLTPDMLTDLLQLSERADWLGPLQDVLQPLNLNRYIRDNLRLAEVTLETVARSLTIDFLRPRSAEWLNGLYLLLISSPNLFRAPSGPNSAGGILRSKPFIRLDNGDHVAPYGAGGEPNAYLPFDDSTSQFPTVHPDITSDNNSLQFLKIVGLHQPDASVEVRRFILPLYSEHGYVPTASDIFAHWSMIFQAMQSTTGTRRNELIKLVRGTALLKCLSAEGAATMLTPESAYWKSPELEEYFKELTDFHFVHELYRTWFETLVELGVASSVRVSTRRVNANGVVIIRSGHGDHARGLNYFDPDIRIDGLPEVLEQPTVTRSLLVWNTLLSPRSTRLSGTVESSGRQDFSRAIRTEQIATLMAPLRAKAWLPSKDGVFHRPDTLALSDLPTDFISDVDLAGVLGMKTALLAQASEELGISASLLHHLQQHPEFVADLENRLKKLADARDRREESDHPTYAEQVETKFATPNDAGASATTASEEDAIVPNAGAVRNPELRRERTRESIELAKQSGPADHSVSVSVKRPQQERDESVRQFLYEQYAGHCQICGATFRSRSGENYFEALHLAQLSTGPHTHRPGGVLCLCPTCCRQLQHGSVLAPNLASKIRDWRAAAEGGQANPELTVVLCGKSQTISYTEKHFLDMQELFHSDSRLDFRDASIVVEPGLPQ